MKTTKYEIELPTLPDGWEVVGNGKYKHGDLRLCPGSNEEGEWYWGCGGEGVNYSIIARQKRTLADWANEQPLFRALAEMREQSRAIVTFVVGCAGNAWWNLTCTGSDLRDFKLGAPPLSGKLTLENGKWKDVT